MFYKKGHALITPESHVFSPLPEWYLQLCIAICSLKAILSVIPYYLLIRYVFDRTNTLGAYLITPALGSHFVMYLAKMQGLFLFALPVIYVFYFYSSWGYIPTWFSMIHVKDFLSTLMSHKIFIIFGEHQV